ncbi:MAG: NADH-quinone oxidoreductase subunit NuoF [Victivallales bacterium]|nr:NADH-quinone oxidoreductase subunit NuoF [Victivallales bacterium]MBT7162303.1 NADH-quinone oxidoreductase subunit NuoF [Victivallales bacterium]
MTKARMHVMIPVDADSVIIGAREIKSRFSAEIGRRGLADEITVMETGSFGPTNAGVIAAVQPDGVVYGNLTPDTVAEIIEEHLVKGRICGRHLLPREYPPPVPSASDSRQTQYAGRIVLDNCGRIDPESVDEYIANDGYFALGTALTEMTPEQVLRVVTDSGLRGRGGAGFPTGMKWGFCARVEGDQKYIICNADEGEPGTFKDRLIMEGDPHKVVEGMALCGYAIGATMGYVYIRGEYKLSIERIEKAIAGAHESGLLGEDLFGSGFAFDIEVKIGAGAYVCGEETALIESMEGKRGVPRLKPPFPAESGYLGKPTNVNNVETLATIPAIVRNGAKWFKGFGTPGTPGTKVYTIIGHVNRPGLIEVPAGVTLREVLTDYAGGMATGEFKMAQLGGTAGEILGPEMLDVPMDYDAMTKVGHVLGSGAILIMNETVSINAFLDSCMHFFRHESCGNCNPCRNGMKALTDITGRLKAGQGYAGDVNLMEELVMSLKTMAYCPLGQSPAGPIMSATRYFREEVEAGVDLTLVRPDPAHIQLDLVELNV